jgi:hypothetical protein
MLGLFEVATEVLVVFVDGVSERFAVAAGHVPFVEQVTEPLAPAPAVYPVAAAVTDTDAGPLPPYENVTVYCPVEFVLVPPPA